MRASSPITPSEHLVHRDVIQESWFQRTTLALQRVVSHGDNSVTFLMSEIRHSDNENARHLSLLHVFIEPEECYTKQFCYTKRQKQILTNFIYLHTFSPLLLIHCFLLSLSTMSRFVKWKTYTTGLTIVSSQINLVRNTPLNRED